VLLLLAASLAWLLTEVCSDFGAIWSVSASEEGALKFQDDIGEVRMVDMALLRWQVAAARLSG
jgi:hypothetical protein